MHLIWKGRYEKEEDLLRGDLPESAVPLREPDGPEALGRAALPFLVPPLLLCLAAIAAKGLYWGEMPRLFHFGGILLTAACILPHEILHAAAFPKGAKTEIWHNLSQGIVFVYCPTPVSKRRFLLMSFLPNGVFGLLPLLIWLFAPPEPAWTGILFTAAITGLPLGAGDYLNIYNVARQVPKGALTQLHGFHSFWFFPE